MLYVPLCILGFAIQVIFIVTEGRDKYIPAVILKGIASFVFILFGILSARHALNTTFAIWIIAGLIMGGFGDVLLNLRYLIVKAGQKVFLLGVAAFLTGHLLYLAALIPLYPPLLVYTVPLGIILAAFVIYWLLHKVSVDVVHKVFGTVYIGVIVLMTAISIGLFMAFPGKLALRLFALGALFFTVSDLVLVLNLFSPEKKRWMRPTILTVYYVGQLLIAASLQFI